MNIGEAAVASGVSAKLIRYYESVGLVPRAGRTESGYRVYTDRDVHTLRFVKCARTLGFSIARIGMLVELWQSKDRSAIEVRRIASDHIAELQTKILELMTMVEALQELADSCERNDRAECPILRRLEQMPIAEEKFTHMVSASARALYNRSEFALKARSLSKTGTSLRAVAPSRRNQAATKTKQ